MDKIPTDKEIAQRLMNKIVTGINKNELHEEFVAGRSTTYSLMKEIGLWNSRFDLNIKNIPFSICMKVVLENKQIPNREVTGFQCRFWKGISRS